MKPLLLPTASGTSLYPITQGVSKQLLPIYDRPMGYEPISGRMVVGTLRGSEFNTTLPDC